MRAQSWESRVLWRVGHGMNDIYWFMLPSLLPVILAQFDLGYGSAGAMLTAFLGTIAVFSAKGGVGRTAIAHNLAVAMGQSAGRVVLVDGDQVRHGARARRVVVEGGQGEAEQHRGGVERRAGPVACEVLTVADLDRAAPSELVQPVAELLGVPEDETEVVVINTADTWIEIVE